MAYNKNWKDCKKDSGINFPKNTLDSDEDDSSSDENANGSLNESDIEAQEEGTAKIQDDTKFTAFNMHEELLDGSFHKGRKRNIEIRDNWLDNIDQMKVYTLKGSSVRSSTGSTGTTDQYNELQAYAELFTFMEKGETVQKTLQRLGRGRTKISTLERLRRKKLGIKEESIGRISKFTELIHEILTKSGNIDIYQETYMEIQHKLNNIHINKEAKRFKENATNSSV